MTTSRNRTTRLFVSATRSRCQVLASTMSVIILAAMREPRAAASQHNEANRRAVTRRHSTYTAAVRQPRYDTDHYHEQRPARVYGRQPTAHESRRQRTTHQRPSGQLYEDEWPVIGDRVHRKPDRRQPARHYEGATHAPCFFYEENGHNMENCRHGQKIVCHACHCLGHKAKLCTR